MDALTGLMTYCCTQRKDTEAKIGDDELLSRVVGGAATTAAAFRDQGADKRDEVRARGDESEGQTRARRPPT